MVRLALALVLCAAAAVAIGSCTLLDDDPPDDHCTFDTECFRAQGEFCNPNTKRCEVMTTGDAGVDAP